MIEVISTLLQWGIVLSIPFVIYLRFKPEVDALSKQASAILEKIFVECYYFLFERKSSSPAFKHEHHESREYDADKDHIPADKVKGPEEERKEGSDKGS